MLLPALFRRVAPCFVCILLSLPVLGAGDPPPSPGGAAGLAEIEALVAGRRFEEALARLPLPGRGVAADKLFLYGLAAIGAAGRPGLAEAEREPLLDRAIAALRTMLIDDPRLVRVRLELARAFFLKGEDGLARGHFEHVLAGNPPPNVAANVARFLHEMRARRRWSFHLGATLAPDSNIASASEARVIYALGAPAPVSGTAPVTSGVGVALWGGAEYQHPLGRRLRLRAGADAVRWEYRHSRFDRTFLSAHFGPRWLLDRRTEASLLAGARQLWVGGPPSHRDIGARLEVAHRVSRLVTASARASWHGRRYRSRPDLGGPVLDASLNLRWAVGPTVRADLYGGYGWEHPRVLRYRNRNLRLGAGVSVDLPRGFTLGGGGEIRWTRYRGNWWPNTRDGSSRSDRTIGLRASVHNRGFTLGGFSPELVLARETRTTNAQLYDFERFRGELRFVRQF